MVWTKQYFKNLLVGLLIAKSLRLLISNIAHSNGFEAGAYAPAIGWAVAALVVFWLCRAEPAHAAAVTKRGQTGNQPRSSAGQALLPANHKRPSR